MDVAAPMQHAEPAQGRLRMFKEYWARRAAGAPAPEEADNTVMDARTRSMDASVPRLRRGAVNARLAAPDPSSDSNPDDDSDYGSPRYARRPAPNLNTACVLEGGLLQILRSTEDSNVSKKPPPRVAQRLHRGYIRHCLFVAAKTFYVC